MALVQTVEGWLEAGVGPHGLTQAELDARLDRAGSALDALRASHGDGSLPLLQLPARTDDIAEINALASALRDGTTDVVFLGTGGSSLGAQALAQVAGWHVPMVEAFASGPRLHFLDNLDPVTMAEAFTRLPIETTRVLTVSKSGGTAETLVQTLVVMDVVRKSLGDGAIKDRLFGITEPATDAGPNVLRRLLGDFGVETHEHDPLVGGRYSALSNVGLVPAAVAGLDVAAIRAGAARAINPILDCADTGDVPAALGAAALVGLEEARASAVHVLWAYSDRLERLGKWYVQLWSESLGKDGKGSMPGAAVGPVDQHSQQQLYLGGPRDKAITIIQTDAAGKGPVVPADLAERAEQPRYGDRSIGDLVDAMQRATPDTLLRNQRPTRVLRVPQVDEAHIGELMMHFFLETMIAGHLMGVNAFDQPAVEESKVLARQYLDDM